MKLTGTSTTPTRAVANTRTAYCHELWHSRASRSPLTRPASLIAAAARSTTASSSAKVYDVAPSTTATLSGKRRAVRRGRSPSACWRAVLIGSVTGVMPPNIRRLEGAGVALATGGVGPGGVDELDHRPVG